MNQQLIFTDTPGAELDRIVDAMGRPQTVVVADVNTARLVVPALRRQSRTLSDAPVLTILAGDAHKDINGLQYVWHGLEELGATRRTLIVNVGGGVVTDLGGLAAATFKRGLPMVNVPTTLLAAVDASVGAKTGINFNGYKNLIGAFYEPAASLISTCFLGTLPRREFLSGYAEMLKHALLDSNEALSELLRHEPDFYAGGGDVLLDMLRRSVAVKARIVEQDLHETGLRKALNLGHTAGHAFESLAMARGEALPHGYAVAAGCVVALILSHLRLGFPSGALRLFASYVTRHYGPVAFTCDDYPALLGFMAQDKKNNAPGRIAFTLLEDVGRPRTDIVIEPDNIKAALDIYRDLSGI